ncbi:MAG: T9SS type A sorting domain-containing protein [Flavobacteriaceae bacterium]|nr:T9SS type A sorting domain-containing protein [Flavobacteriaceae bacterium]MDG2314052.1 T9SS type A sorting domain-containing protein [Flavobacteriaceae bacterium]
MNNKTFLFFLLLFPLVFSAQNQLPLLNGDFETILDGTQEFSSWTNYQNNVGQVNYSIETQGLIQGSTKALKSEILEKGENNYDVKTQSDYQFRVEAGQTYTVRFWAKVSGASSAEMKVVFQSEVVGSYQGNNIPITQDWQQFTHHFTVSNSSDVNRLSFWYMEKNVTYFLDQVEVVTENSLTLNSAMRFQTVDGFGAGIKRRTESLYALDNAKREQIEALAFQDLEVNMIRFFVYHDLEDPNDNLDAFDLNTSALDWTRYGSSPNNYRSKYIAEALSNAFSLSSQGFDHVIGNCNSAPSWLKTNNSHAGGGTLIAGQENEYSEFLVAFIKGMQDQYGIGVTAISPTNEPDYDVTYESMNTSPSELSQIIINLNQRLTTENLEQIQIISPETFRVTSNNTSKSTTNYINAMFTDPTVVNAVDVIATHAYQAEVTPSDWSALENLSQNKPVWVTESANLHSPNWNMADAQYHIDRMINGFNHGGLTGYMAHLFYERHKLESEVVAGAKYGSSALVLWDNANNIVLPKRYYVMKHFANLIKKGYQRVLLNTFEGAPNAVAFVAPDSSKVVVQLFTQNAISDFNLEIPMATTNIAHYITSDDPADNFRLITTDNFDVQSSFVSIGMNAMSLHSFVFTIDTSLAVQDNPSAKNERGELYAYPNPTQSLIKLSFPQCETPVISIYKTNGERVFHKIYSPSNTAIIDTKSFSTGFYFLKLTTENGQQFVKRIIKNQ